MTQTVVKSAVTLEMSCVGYPFSYEWLTCIGASTKTELPGRYVGMYGEGFKICLLCLYRKGLSVCMESADWRLAPCQYIEKIAGTDIPMFGYDLCRRKDDNCTKLTLSGLTAYQAEQAVEAPLNFFYPDNPLFGKKIAFSDDYEIFERSETRIPCKDFFSDMNGILYLNGLARGRLPFDLIIMIRDDLRRKDSRKREVMRNHDVVCLMNEVAGKFDPESSYQILTHMKRFWTDIPSKRTDILTWYYFICQLVRNISENPATKERFLREYHNLTYIDRTDADPIHRKLISETAEWAKKNGLTGASKPVNPIFRLLGAKSLVAEYKSVKLTQYSALPENLTALGDILYDAIESVFPYRLYDTRPEIILGVSKNKTSPLQFSSKKTGRSRNDYRYQLSKIVLARDDFEHGKFQNTFLKTVEDMLAK